MTPLKYPQSMSCHEMTDSSGRNLPFSFPILALHAPGVLLTAPKMLKCIP